MMNKELEGFNMDSPENFENIINNITLNDVQKMAKTLLEDNRSYEIIFKPKPE
ncbi:hypothetical protein [Flavivirga sp. 57AJ16]|uniref:hypothetical protein n=1 Tax=Flavivirga sp. 57AJ16 TaxID=3025307 RepID=UPI0023657A3E|nr:hypothetical protein [Flavivirga sp. 57AJ16]MDD7887818.1 hypothetical protein [Flavivirga sp. 57AJ16]